MNELLASERPDSVVTDEVADGFIGQAPAFREVLAKLPKLASADAAVLISGETGTGKELVARAIHGLSRRTMSPFVAVNCGALIDTLFESELFGHERGAFTDAHARRQGLMAQAAGGTLFLDEADTLTPRGQVALLRALQDRSFRPLGSTSEHRVDVRFLAATNARLDRMVESGSFRADLYYRLCMPLAYHFLRKHASSPGPVLDLSADAVEALLAWDWPGNVRELESAIVRAISVARDGVVAAVDLGLPGLAGGPGAAQSAGAPRTFKTQKRRILEVFERQYLIRLTTEHRGNVSRAARTAGKERRDLGKLLKRHGLDPRQFAGRVGAFSSPVGVAIGA